MPGHIKVPHRDDLIDLKQDTKIWRWSVNIKQLSINDEIVNVYLYISEDKIKSCWLFQIYFGQ